MQEKPMKVSIRIGGAVLAALLAGCTPSAPPRPPSVPPQATWAGTRKAGVFVLVGPQDREAWLIKVFDDRTGAVRAEGPYVLRGAARAEIQAEEIVGFDAQGLHLSDGALMVPRPPK
jgi:hypothetical protein